MHAQLSMFNCTYKYLICFNIVIYMHAKYLHVWTFIANEAEQVKVSNLCVSIELKIMTYYSKNMYQQVL